MQKQSPHKSYTVYMYISSNKRHGSYCIIETNEFLLIVKIFLFQLTTDRSYPLPATYNI